ncbi:YeeE/YedE family protein [Pseudomonas oryzihabitans]|uniref:YeeE/YedE family protein n=1 Tax=Pseudomonas oryzihabitans TaxID=47885 RepID=UPI00285696B9|nr:YeeE/YedE thiosulfate transporter family protein [Pseudomonas psychrotolerans]MDR6677184.1 putative membrane protein YedE/YeeE [Pseudomonas psychrotolerans]
MGLILAPVLARLVDALPAAPIQAGWPLLVVSGALVGVGTGMANGCTSGHGVCGLARGSRRSLAATLTFMATGMLTVFLIRHLGN